MSDPILQSADQWEDMARRCLSYIDPNGTPLKGGHGTILEKADAHDFRKLTSDLEKWIKVRFTGPLDIDYSPLGHLLVEAAMFEVAPNNRLNGDELDVLWRKCERVLWYIRMAVEQRAEREKVEVAGKEEIEAMVRSNGHKAREIENGWNAEHRILI